MLAWITSALCAVNELHSTTRWRPSNSGGVSPPGCSRTRPLVSPSPKQLERTGTPAVRRPAPSSCRRDGAASRAERRRGREVCMTLLRGDGAGPRSAAAAGGGAGESGDDVALGEERSEEHTSELQS